MLGENATPFQAIGFEHHHRDGVAMGVIAVRGVYDLFPDGRLIPSEKQEIIFSDEYEGSPLTTPLLRVSDITPFKPNTDITIIGRTYPPYGERSEFWRFGIDVARLSAVFRCYGLRHWIACREKGHASGWRMSATNPVDYVPLDYRYCPSNYVAGSPYNAELLDNPLGAPLLDPKHSRHETQIPVAMIMHDSDPVIEPGTPIRLAGTGPIAPHWHLRRRFAGSYDEAWSQDQYPHLPKDFDYLFYQAACPGMMWQGFMRGDEDMTLYQMTCGYDVVRFQLPQIQPFVRASWIDDRQVVLKLNLDGVHCDLRGREPPWRIDLTWRGWIEICPQFFKMDLLMTNVTDKAVEEMLQCDVHGLTSGLSA